MIAWGNGSGLWLAFVGWFLLLSTSAEAATAKTELTLRRHLTAEIAAAPRPPNVRADATAREAASLMMKSGCRALLVTVGDVSVGLLTIEDFRRLRERDASDTYVTALMTPKKDLPEISALAPATDALELIEQSHDAHVAVLDPSGNLVGVVTRESIDAFTKSQSVGTTIRL
jgi:CBS domain-containing protein